MKTCKKKKLSIFFPPPKCWFTNHCYIFTLPTILDGLKSLCDWSSAAPSAFSKSMVFTRCWVAVFWSILESGSENFPFQWKHWLVATGGRNLKMLECFQSNWSVDVGFDCCLCLCVCRLLSCSQWREPGRLWRWLRRNSWDLWGWRPSTLSTAHIRIYTVHLLARHRAACLMLELTVASVPSCQWHGVLRRLRQRSGQRQLQPGQGLQLPPRTSEWNHYTSALAEKLPPSVLLSVALSSSLLVHHNIEYWASSQVTSGEQQWRNQEI